MSIYDDFTDEQAKALRRDGFALVPTGEHGCDTGRRRWMIACLRCMTLLHDATTGPGSRAEQHRREGCRKSVPNSPTT